MLRKYRLCPHRKRKTECKVCYGCKHGRLRGHCVECGGHAICLHKKHRTKCPDCSPMGVYKGYAWGAKKRSQEFLLSFEEYSKISSSACVYCGDQSGRNGIDRKNNSLGYTVKNSVSCCSKCNLMKRDYTEKEFLDHIIAVFEYQFRFRTT